MQPIRAVIFDFDGVIADSEIVSSRVLADGLTEAGLHTTPAEARDRYTGLNRADTLAAIAAQWGGRVPADLAERMDKATMVAFSAGVTPVPGAIDFIRAVAHFPRAIASSSASVVIRAHLKDFGIEDVFGMHIYSGREHVDRGKPWPDLYLHAASALGVAPAQALVIEDSPVGARAAVAAGARVIGLAAASHCTPTLTAALAAEGVEAVFDGYADIRRYFTL